MNTHFPTGEWNGFYIEHYRDSKGWMHLYLQFENGVIKGEGTDYVGPWTAIGEYDESSGRCSWEKQYLGKHSVQYEGIAGENGIQGSWTILSQGPFHIWPRSMTHLNELYLQDEILSGESTDTILLNTQGFADLV